MRSQFTFYDSFYDAICDLDESEQLVAYQAIAAYALRGELPNISGAPSAVFKLIKPILDKAAQKAETGRNGGKQSGSKRKANDKQTESKKEGEKEVERENEVEIENECYISPPVFPQGGSAKTEKRFSPPSVDEVREYCLERKNGVDAEQFVNFYESKGWKVGKNPMKDWKAAVRTWEKRDGRGPMSATDQQDFEWYAARTRIL